MKKEDINVKTLLGKKIPWDWVFLFAMLFLYLALAVFDFFLFSVVFSAFVKLFFSILPALVLVFVLMFLFNLLVEAKDISKFFTGSKGISLWLGSVIFGILSTGPIYVWYPLLKHLNGKGLKKKFLAVFLYNRAVKLPLLPVMVYYFGLTFTVVLTILMVVFSILNGLIVGMFVRE